MASRPRTFVKATSLLRSAVDEFERRYLLQELLRNRWNRAKTARDLGISYRTLLYKIERFRLAAPDADAAGAVV
jgi:two-component system, NtrC family, response regulator AtoC